MDFARTSDLLIMAVQAKKKLNILKDKYKVSIVMNRKLYWIFQFLRNLLIWQISFVRPIIKAYSELRDPLMGKGNTRWRQESQQWLWQFFFFTWILDRVLNV